MFCEAKGHAVSPGGLHQQPEWFDEGRIKIFTSKKVYARFDIQHGQEQDLAMAMEQQLCPMPVPPEELRASCDGGKLGGSGTSRKAQRANCFYETAEDQQAVTYRVWSEFPQFDVEAIALDQLLLIIDEALQDGHTVVRIFTDANGVLQALENSCSRLENMTKIRQGINKILENHQGTTVEIFWVPSHRGFRLNVIADGLGQLDDSPEDVVCEPISKQRVKLIAREERKGSHEAVEAEADRDVTTLHRASRVRALGRLELAGLKEAQQRVALSLWSGESFLPATMVKRCPRGWPVCRLCDGDVKVKRVQGGAWIKGFKEDDEDQDVRKFSRIVDHLLVECPAVPDAAKYAGKHAPRVIQKCPKTQMNRLMDATQQPENKISLSHCWPYKSRSDKPTRAEEMAAVPRAWLHEGREALKRRKLDGAGAEQEGD